MKKQKAITEPTTDQKFVQHLEGLNKEELIQLVVRLADPQFVRQITGLYADTKSAAKAANAAGKEIKKLFNDKTYSKKPVKLEEELMKSIESLRPLWLLATNEVIEVFQNVSSYVQTGIRTGFLKSGSGKYQKVFVGDGLAEHWLAFAEVLPTKQKFEFFLRVHSRYEPNSGFADKFWNAWMDCFSIEERPELVSELNRPNPHLENLPTSTKIELYRRFGTPEMTLKCMKKEFINNADVLFQLVDFLILNGKPEEGLEHIEFYLDHHKSDYWRISVYIPVYVKWVEVKALLGLLDYDTMLGLLDKFRYSDYYDEVWQKFTPEFLYAAYRFDSPKLKLGEIEGLIKTKYPVVFAEYLDKCERIDELFTFVYVELTPLGGKFARPYFTKYLERWAPASHSLF